MTRLKPGKSFRTEELNILSHGFRHSFIHAYPGAAQLHERASPDTAHYHGIHFLSFKCADRIAHAVGMVTVGIMCHPDRHCIGVDDDKGRGRAEVPVHFTFEI
jgi:hypothetical protein